LEANDRQFNNTFSVFLLILKKIEVETLAAIVAAMLAAGYIPKAKDDVSE